jgi:hypothetical protein
MSRTFVSTFAVVAPERMSPSSLRIRVHPVGFTTPPSTTMSVRLPSFWMSTVIRYGEMLWRRSNPKLSSKLPAPWTVVICTIGSRPVRLMTSTPSRCSSPSDQSMIVTLSRLSRKTNRGQRGTSFTLLGVPATPLRV